MNKIWLKHLMIIGTVMFSTAHASPMNVEQSDQRGSNLTASDFGLASVSSISTSSGLFFDHEASKAGVRFVDPIFPIAETTEIQIQVDKIARYVGELITIRAIENFSKRSFDQAIDMSWQIVNSQGNEILSAKNVTQLEWIPEAPGEYTLNFQLTDTDLVLVTTRTLYVLKRVDKDVDLIERFWLINEKLVGTWTGRINSTFGDETFVDIIFYGDGSYTMSRFSQGDAFFPKFEAFPDLPSGVINGDKVIYDPIGLNNSLRFNQEKGRYELLDIWAIGEAFGNMWPNIFPPIDSENMKRIRFTEDFNGLFFELSLGPYSGKTDTVILSRVSELAPAPNLSLINEKLIGEWQGSVMTPWAMPYNVRFEFNDDNTYRAESLSDTMLIDGDALGRVSAFYFGAAIPTLENLPFTIDNFVGGVASGGISLQLKNGDVVMGEISDLEMSINYNRLMFTFKHYGKYGPIRFILERK